jgi:hypothetical protein
VLVAKALLNIPGGESSGVHLHYQTLQGFGVTVEELHEPGVVWRRSAPNLRHPHPNLSLGGLQGALLLTIAVEALVVVRPGTVPLVARAAKEVLLLLLEGLLEEVAHSQLSECREHFAAGIICSRTITDGGTFLISGLGLLLVDLQRLQLWMLRPLAFTGSLRRHPANTGRSTRSRKCQGGYS